MSPSSFRKIALSFPETEGRSHQGHPDFRVGGKVFASLNHPKEGWAAAALTPKQQAALMDENPEAFRPAAGVWGKRGWTLLLLRKTTNAQAREALIAAWRNKAPKKLAALVDVQ